ncbi:DUF1559 domain-containing protein [Aeoliella mucimassa]|uniref:DUF1559 domain-containing protein n=1 Tax=Aeoliella mucimassa TaxID=2527972 RepID=A0A518AUA4_9BACT|nr:DUF1559 domain-containing protein [Aeoliella mucimassa]QDU58314.1 hypothetical protein Pan181_45470 [Aeoliella mucimassa]
MRQTNSSRHAAMRGFTLVELLVVIAIIGTLVALLLPAVQSARESGRRATCTNNIRQLALAMQNYDSSAGHLPGYVNDIENTRSAKDNNFQYTEARQATWVVMLFPYLEQQALWDNWSDATQSLSDSANTPELPMLECTSNARDIPGSPWLSYVANSGQLMTDPTRNGVGESAANGVFVDRSVNLNALPSTGAADGRESAKPPQVSIGSILDGTSNTVMFSENLYTFYWTYVDGNNNPVANSQNKDDIFKDNPHWFGFGWTNSTASGNDGQCDTNWLKINGVSKDAAPIIYMNKLDDCYSYPSSNHPGGVNMAFCDARVEFVTDGIDLTVYGQLLTSNARRSSYAPGGTPDRNLPPVSGDAF